MGPLGSAAIFFQPDSSSTDDDSCGSGGCGMSVAATSRRPTTPAASQCSVVIKALSAANCHKDRLQNSSMRCLNVMMYILLLAFCRIVRDNRLQRGDNGMP